MQCKINFAAVTRKAPALLTQKWQQLKIPTEHTASFTETLNNYQSLHPLLPELLLQRATFELGFPSYLADIFGMAFYFVLQLFVMNGAV